MDETRFEPCPPCKIIIDGGALIAAAFGLLFQALFNTIADAYSAIVNKGRSDEGLALSEYDCKLAAFIRERTVYIRLARVGTSPDGKHGIYGGEYKGDFNIDAVKGISKK